jgi:hypothetical protein
MHLYRLGLTNDLQPRDVQHKLCSLKQDKLDYLMSNNLTKVVLNQKKALKIAQKGKLRDALRYINIALKKDKKNSTSYFIKGRLHWELLEYKFSLVAFTKCVSLDTDNVKAKMYIGLIYLTVGNFKQGCDFYRFRHEATVLSRIKHVQEWSPSRQSGSVIIWAEQGIGDEIMFFQFLPFLKDLKFEFTLECDHRLHQVLSINFPWVNLIKRGENTDPSEFDFQLPAGDLLRVFQDKVNQVKFSTLAPPPSPEVTAVLDKHTKSGKSFVGISWLSMNQEHGLKRSMPIEQLCEGLDPYAHILVNLQYLASKNDITKVRDLGFEVIDEFDSFNDISAVFALIASCTKVITIDNSVAHFAGALGANTQVWLPKLANWRWGVNKETSYFYRSVNLNYLK